MPKPVTTAILLKALADALRDADEQTAVLWQLLGRLHEQYHKEKAALAKLKKLERGKRANQRY